VCVERTSWLPVTLLGVLKAGGYYVPIDPAFPRDRLALMMDGLPSPVLITESTLLARLPAWPAAILRLGALKDDLATESTTAPATAAVRAEQLAYMIFTSGSTGRPKGVQIAHGGLASILQSFAREPGLAARDVLVALTTLSFDISVLEIFLPLVIGGRVTLATRAIAGDGFRLAAFLQRTGATVMQATPPSWRVLLAADWQPAPGFRAWCGGEA
jgi:non-ribosomal peptide synthetase component F